ncbi:2-hydroxy-3-oxopropionate reductase [Propionibacterium cyclohexanicum]|uniref:2-hydroxy-3-oxopropionate reductase n=1 Tax=Propionibacterium cyclohexanicum TaxID=64702 RepID=A0A1H9T849_9ACTN|nr:NAD(P)-dependent oxidoreductase [Propionibacterium cyclohexanicum]SER93124.1 2-hydroxy-3-oxopropionate reductase [Propionibacterium cyclohexanicum]
MTGQSRPRSPQETHSTQEQKSGESTHQECTTREQIADGQVGFIGLGAMGLPMARHLHLALSEGTPPRCLNVSARHRIDVAHTIGPGVRWHEDARSLAACCEVVVFMVPDLPQVREVLAGPHGLLAGFEDSGARATIVISSSVSPIGLRQLDAEVRESSAGRVRLVDAPVSGGVEGAAAGTLAVMVGGAAEDVGPVKPLLASFGRPVHLGPLGSGQVAKACNQMIVAATVEALGEAAVLAERCGLDLGALLDLLQDGYAGSRLLEISRDRLVHHDHRPSGPAKFMVKDLAFARQIDQDCATFTPLADRLGEIFSALVAAGFGEQNLTVVQSYLLGMDGARTPPGA